MAVSGWDSELIWLQHHSKLRLLCSMLLSLFLQTSNCKYQKASGLSKGDNRSTVFVYFYLTGFEKIGKQYCIFVIRMGEVIFVLLEHRMLNLC
ncbi:hypothetical protein BX666DRAFT_1995323 [Dichotomocladium elegans]|nr:hypothetical protein BX666DRAFT_1995323 [Dichotomocladium elegans]